MTRFHSVACSLLLLVTVPTRGHLEASVQNCMTRALPMTDVTYQDTLAYFQLCHDMGLTLLEEPVRSRQFFKRTADNLKTCNNQFLKLTNLSPGALSEIERAVHHLYSDMLKFTEEENVLTPIRKSSSRKCFEYQTSGELTTPSQDKYRSLSLVNNVWPTKLEIVNNNGRKDEILKKTGRIEFLQVVTLLLCLVSVAATCWTCCLLFKIFKEGKNGEEYENLCKKQSNSLCEKLFSGCDCMKGTSEDNQDSIKTIK